MGAQVTVLHRLLHRFLSRSTGFQGFFPVFYWILPAALKAADLAI
jgi:hypothetical protein